VKEACLNFGDAKPVRPASCGGFLIVRALAPSLLMPPTLALFWSPYADWIYTVLSTTGLLLIVWLVLRPK
jgi:hypothetical protein